MTGPADARAAEVAFEAALAGRPVPDGASGVAAFTDAVRAEGTAPGRPNAALADLLATGLLTTHQEPSPGTAGHSARTSRKRPRMLLSTLVAKIIGAGALAKAAAGTGVVVVALAGATTAGVVTPQDPTTSVVESPATQEDVDPDPTVEPDPLTGTDPGTGTDDGTDTDVADDTPAETPTETPVGTPQEPVVTPAPELTPWHEGPDQGQSHGDWVSEGARAGGVDGGTVSTEAHRRNEQRRKAREAAPAPAPVVQEPATEEPVAEAPTVADSRPGTGNGGGNGNGRK